MAFGINSEGKEILFTDGKCDYRQSYNGPLKSIDIAKGTHLTPFGNKMEFGVLSAIAVSSNQQYVLASWSGGKDPIVFWNLNKSKYAALLQLESIRTIHMEKEKQLIIATRSKEVHIIRLRTQELKNNFRKPIKVIPNPQLGPIADMKVSSDGHYLAVVYQTQFQDDKVKKDSPGGAIVWDIKSRKPIWKLRKTEDDQVLEAHFVFRSTKKGKIEVPVFYGYNDHKGSALKWEFKRESSSPSTPQMSPTP